MNKKIYKESIRIIKLKLQFKIIKTRHQIKNFLFNLQIILR
jgi:hypothetical protein